MGILETGIRQNLLVGIRNPLVLSRLVQNPKTIVAIRNPLYSTNSKPSRISWTYRTKIIVHLYIISLYYKYFVNLTKEYISREVYLFVFLPLGLAQ